MGMNSYWPNWLTGDYWCDCSHSAQHWQDGSRRNRLEKQLKVEFLKVKSLKTRHDLDSDLYEQQRQYLGLKSSSTVNIDGAVQIWDVPESSMQEKAPF